MHWGGQVLGTQLYGLVHCRYDMIMQKLKFHSMLSNIINSVLDHIISSRIAKAVTFEVLSLLELVASWSFDIFFAGRTWRSACTDLRSGEQNLSGEISWTVHKCFLECSYLDCWSCNVGYQLCGCSRYLCQSIAWFHGEKQKFWCKTCSSIFFCTVVLFNQITISINFFLSRTM
jgi:hypothetical protein